MNAAVPPVVRVIPQCRKVLPVSLLYILSTYIAGHTAVEEHWDSLREMWGKKEIFNDDTDNLKIFWGKKIRLNNEMQVVCSQQDQLPWIRISFDHP